MIVASLAFLAGVALVQWFPYLPSPGYALLPLLLLVFSWRGVRSPGVWFCAGLLWAWGGAAWQLHRSLPQAWEGKDLQVRGQVAGLVERTGDRDLRMRFAVESVLIGDRWQPFSLPVRLNWYATGREPAAGETWRLTVRLKRPHGFANPGGFDYERWLFSQGIRATGYVRNDPGNGRVAVAQGYRIDRLRGELRRQMRPVTESLRTGALLEALTLGVRDGMDEGHWRVLRRTGTAHLMAISGLHVGLVSGALFWLARRFWSRSGLCDRCPAILAASVAALLGALAYGALAGYSVPTRRAVVMVAAVLLSLLWRRGLRPGHSLALALMAVLWMDPLAVLETGFWLSFAAVALLLLVLDQGPEQARYWRALGRMQWTLGLGMMPLSLLLFQEVSLVAPLTNLVAVPWVGLLVVPVSLLSALMAGLWPGLAMLGWQLAGQLLELLWAGLELAGQLPLSSWQQGSGSAWRIAAALTGVLFLLMARSFPLRLAGIPLLLPLLCLRGPDPPEGGAWVTLADVGQGLAVVVRTRRHTLVYDTGPGYPSGFNTGEAVLLPLLRDQGVTGVDRLVISHGDNDHIGGARALLAGLPVYSIRTSVPADVAWARSRRCRAGEQWRWDGVRFAMLGPVRDGLAGNDASCVLLVEAAGHRLLLPGDIEAEGERSLLDSGADLSADILVAPHHGSLTSSSPDFIAAVRPDLVLFATGYRNRWNFPRPRIVERYRRHGGRLLSTAGSGAVRLRLEPGRDLKVNEWRKAERRYWNAVPPPL